MGLRKSLKSFRDWCPQPPDRLPTQLKKHYVPIAAIVTASIILSVSLFAFSGLMSNTPVPVVPLTYLGSSTNPTLLWNYTTGDLVWSPPDVVNGVVYVGSTDGNIYALNATNGAKIWNYTTGGMILASPTVVNGIVYGGSSNGNVYALNANSGVKLWNFTAGAPASNFCGINANAGSAVGSSPVVADGVVYIGSYNGNIYALNLTTGAKLWSYNTGGWVWSSAIAGGVIYVGSSGSNVCALNATNGTELWSCVTGLPAISWGGVPSPILSSPVIVGQVVYVGSDNGTVYALNAGNGMTLWNYTTYIEPGTPSVFSGNEILSSPFIDKGVLYVGSNSGDFYALNATNGNKIWNSTTSGEEGTSPAVVGGVIYIANGDGGDVYALNATNGGQLWSYTTSYLSTTSPTFSNGVLYAGGDDSVFALRVTSQTPQSEPPSPTMFSSTQLIIIDGLVAVIVASIVVLVLMKKPKGEKAFPMTG